MSLSLYLDVPRAVAVEAADGADTEGEVVDDVPRGHVLALLAQRQRGGVGREGGAPGSTLSVQQVRVLVHVVDLD